MMPRGTTHQTTDSRLPQARALFLLALTARGRRLRRIAKSQLLNHGRVVVGAEDAPVFAGGEDLLRGADAVVWQARVGRGRLDAVGEVLCSFDQDGAQLDDRLVGC